MKRGVAALLLAVALMICMAAPAGCGGDTIPAGTYNITSFVARGEELLGYIGGENFYVEVTGGGKCKLVFGDDENEGAYKLIGNKLTVGDMEGRYENGTITLEREDEDGTVKMVFALAQ